RAGEAHVSVDVGPSGSRLPESEAVQPIPIPSATGARWYRGDLHLHTVHSDGERHPVELASAARARGLDFIVSTEHNTNSANRAWPACHTSGLLAISGEEVTTRHGHWLAAGRLGRLAVRAERRGVSALRRRGSRRGRSGGRRTSVRAATGGGVGVRL